MATGIILANSFPTPPPLTSTSLTALYSILRRLHLRISHYRPLILPYFQDFDTQHTGTVTYDQFARVLTIVKTELQADELSLLTRAYLAADISKVDYRRFLHDVDDDDNGTYKRQEECKETLHEAEVTRGNRTLRMQPAASTPSPTPSLAVVTHRLQTLASQQRQSISDLFDDFDPLRKRTVTQTQFRRCLDVSGLQLSQDELDVLLQAYTRGGEVRYMDFILSITTAFIPHQPELDPLSTPPTFTPYPLHTCPPASSSCPTTLPTSLDELLHPIPVAPLLTRMAYLSSTRRILLKPPFAAHDRAHDGCCSQATFTAVLSSLFPSMSLTQQDMTAVCREYQRGAKGIAYTAFCQDVQTREAQYEQDQARAAQLKETQVTDHNRGWEEVGRGSSTLERSGSVTAASPLAGPFTSTLSQPLTDVDALLLSLRETLARHRLDLGSAFDDFDRLRRGSVGRTVFFRVLSMWGLRVREEEVQLLSDRFACKGEGREGEVNYAAFLDALSFIPKV